MPALFSAGYLAAFAIAPGVQQAAFFALVFFADAKTILAFLADLTDFAEDEALAEAAQQYWVKQPHALVHAPVAGSQHDLSDLQQPGMVQHTPPAQQFPPTQQAGGAAKAGGVAKSGPTRAAAATAKVAPMVLYERIMFFPV